jgi:hypothetical protein
MKTAGTTLNYILENQFYAHEVCPAFHWDELLLETKENLQQYKLFRGHFYYSLQSLLQKDLIYMTFLRNPLERVLSHYYYAQREPNYYIQPQVNEHYETLQKFIEAPSMRMIVSNHQVRSLILDEDISEITKNTSQFNTYADLESEIDRRMRNLSEDNMLQIAKQRLEKFAFIGLVERFDDSLDMLTYRFNWNHVSQYSNRNVTVNRPKQEEIPSDILKKLRQLNQLDYELYDFAETIFKKRFAEKHFKLVVPKIPTPKSLKYTFEQPLQGSGWHRREMSDKYGTFRWTGPETVSTIDFHIAATNDLIVSIKFFAAVTPETLGSFRVSANGENMPITLRHNKDESIQAEGIINSHLIKSQNGNLKLSFSVASTVSPKSIEVGDDERKLGMAIFGVSLQRLSMRSKAFQWWQKFKAQGWKMKFCQLFANAWDI